MKELIERSGGNCELCNASNASEMYTIAPAKEASLDDSLLLCSTCNQQITDPESIDVNHWRCLNDSMWSTHPPVQIMAWRMLNALKAEGWPQDLLDIMYLDDETLAKAKVGLVSKELEQEIIHKDSNGVRLNSGDSVVIIKDLNVKGSSIVAKRGAAVRNINLVYDNAEQIEGKVDGQTIVILCQYVKKTS